jgi:hypothetical protein
MSALPAVSSEEGRILERVASKVQLGHVRVGRASAIVLLLDARGVGKVGRGGQTGDKSIAGRIYRDASIDIKCAVEIFIVASAQIG